MLLESLDLKFEIDPVPYSYTRSVPEPESTPRDGVLFYIAKNHSHLDHLDEIERSERRSEDWHYYQGKFYGYPDCCVKYHSFRGCKGYSSIRKLRSELELEPNRGLKFAENFFDPCSRGCEKAEEMGARWLELLEEMFGYEFTRKIEEEWPKL